MEYRQSLVKITFGNFTLIMFGCQLGLREKHLIAGRHRFMLIFCLFFAFLSVCDIKRCENVEKFDFDLEEGAQSCQFAGRNTQHLTSFMNAPLKEAFSKLEAKLVKTFPLSCNESLILRATQKMLLKVCAN